MKLDECVNLRIIISLLQAIIRLKINRDKCEFIGTNLCKEHHHSVQTTKDLQYALVYLPYQVLWPTSVRQGDQKQGWALCNSEVLRQTTRMEK